MKFLKTFQIAARRGSFKAAARELCITASAVSHQIKVLEDQLGLALFRRGPRSLSLTEAGTHYLANIDALFSRLETVTAQLQIRFRRRLLRLRAPPFFASELLLPQLGRFSADHPDTDLQVVAEVGPQNDHSADADVSIVVGAGPWPTLRSVALFSQVLVPACTPTHLRDTPVDIEDRLSNQALIVQNDRPDLWDQWALANGLQAPQPRQLIRLDTMTEAVNAAEQGLGIALVSAPLAARRFATGKLARAAAAQLQTGEIYHLLVRPEDSGRPDVSAFTQWLLAELAPTIE
ncbi:MAG TPA: LysR substrate-binding domain-containing protein [Steroidobacteraceae bacterium]|nr:LysR substrate-binding domain-containing protein [Steroidobacteraceae bacterium]